MAKKKPVKPTKRVRLTIEVDEQFIRLLNANIQLTAAARGWLLDTDEASHITPPQVLGLLVLMEARGGHPEEIAAKTPFMWRPNIDVIHEERRVYSGNTQISGPVLEPKALETAEKTQSGKGVLSELA